MKIIVVRNCRMPACLGEMHVCTKGLVTGDKVTGEYNHKCNKCGMEFWLDGIFPHTFDPCIDNPPEECGDNVPD